MMKRRKWIVGLLAIAVVAVITGGWAWRTYEKDQVLYLTDLDPDEVLDIRVVSWIHTSSYFVEFTEREEIEKIVNDWNTVVLEPVEWSDELETERYMVTIKLSTGDTDSFGLGEGVVRRYPYGRMDNPQAAAKAMRWYRVDERIYDRFFEEEKKSPDFDHESYELEQRMEEIERESQERMEKKRKEAEEKAEKEAN